MVCVCVGIITGAAKPNKVSDNNRDSFHREDGTMMSKSYHVK